MALDFLPALLAIITILPALALFLQKKLIHAVVFLALASGSSAAIFLYLNQVLVALLQLLVFVGGLSTYLIVAIAAEEKRFKLASNAVFFVASAVIALVLSLLVLNIQAPQAGGNDFSAVAQAAFQNYYALLFASVFLLFAGAVGSVLVIKKFSRLVV